MQIVAPINQAGQSIKRFNQYALHLTQPGSRWINKSLKLGIIISALNFVIIASYLLIPTLLSGQEYVSRHHGEINVVWQLFGSILFAPLVETALLVLIYALTWSWLGLSGFVLVNTGVFAAIHIPFKGFPIAATIAFLIMSYQYVSFRNSIGSGKAFAGVVLSHSVINTVSSAIIILDS